MEKNTLCQEVEQRLCDQMFRYLQKQGYEISRKNDSAISGLSTEDEVRAYQKRIHDAFCCSLREDMCSGVLADAVCTGTVKRAHYRIEKVVLTTKNNVKITFFMVGDWIDKYPEAVKKINEAGQEIRKS